MKRILKALGAFALSLTFVLSMASMPVSAAESALSGDSETSSGYIVVLNAPPASPFSFDPLAAATLMDAEDEREELFPLAKDWNIYIAGSLEEVQSLVYSGQVAVLEPDYEAELFDLDLANPDDPMLAQQVNLIGNNGVAVRSAWEAGLTGEGVTVAVIDSGINDTHEDAPLKIGRGRYFYYREEADGRYELDGKRYGYYSSNNYVDDVSHGSMVCGIIAAASGNGKGVSSIAPGATILPIRCFTKTKGHLGGRVSNLISGLNFAVENGADIINMSWGVTTPSSSLQTAVDAAYRAGCILIAASGNDGAAASTITRYPAAWDNVISVGATDELGRLPYYSQRTKTVDVCAPGGSSAQRIVSTGYSSSSHYDTKIGTSFSAPAVSAAAALLLQADPTMTQGDFLTLLQATSHEVTQAVDSSGRVTETGAAYSGAGRMDIQALLDEVGYAGCTAKRTQDGCEVYAAYHPTKDSSVDRLIAMVGGYNAKGHLVESHSDTLNKTQYNNCAKAFTFSDPTITEFRTFYLDDTTFAALTQPVIPLLGG